MTAMCSDGDAFILASVILEHQVMALGQVGLTQVCVLHYTGKYMKFY
jgi:hypothetical protein